MKDLHDMTDRNERFLKAKSVLDGCIGRVSALAGDAYAEAIACCAAGELDTRDELQDVAAQLRAAESHLIMARSAAGRINSGGITRSGGS